MKEFKNDSCFFRRGGLHQAHLAQLVAFLGLNLMFTGLIVGSGKFLH